MKKEGSYAKTVGHARKPMRKKRSGALRRKDGGGTMKTVILDLTGCQSLWAIHERIRIAFDFPEWYGKNWPGYYAVLARDCGSSHVIVRGYTGLPDDFRTYVKRIYGIFDETARSGETRRPKVISYGIVS